MPGWGQLVPELLAEVQQILVDELNEWKADKDAEQQLNIDKRRRQAMPRHPLLTATRVNRHWNRVATRQLYSNLYLHKLETIRPLVKALLGNFALIEHIKCVTIDFKYLNLSTQKKAREKEMQRRRKASGFAWSLLNLLNSGRLRHLSIVGSALEPLPIGVEDWAPPACITGLKGLDIVERFHATQWVEAAAPTVERLKLPHDISAMPAVQALSFPNLKSFCAKPIITVDGAIIKCIKQLGYAATSTSSQVQLEDLSIGGLELEPDVIHRILSRSANTLRRLHLQPQCFPEQLFRKRFSDFRQKIIDVLPTCLTLEVLELELNPSLYQNWIPVEEPDAKEKLLELVDALPSNLQVLVLYADFTSNKENLTAVAQRILQRDLPNLRRVELPSRNLVYSHHKPLQVAEEFASLAELFEPRGIVARFDRRFPEHLPWVFRD
ncbi:hypothetical protein BKA62DRAFT_765728 [Auriculariales sp. MPI-PUGE-AT-0066]|nr:hypothetical protein BKA62DRAFT_765728 [Auriculariales sp. MPI-PUGE-AT-0066]